ncbi:MAG: hypothetical protein JJW00_00215 [Sulfurimonas sp.]|nr:hypothetical protein [Sulfurimonas sp.]
MARESIIDKITELEEQRDKLRIQLTDNAKIKTLQGQGSQGARTEFFDPTILRRLLKEIMSELSVLYRYKGM